MQQPRKSVAETGSQVRTTHEVQRHVLGVTHEQRICTGLDQRLARCCVALVSSMHQRGPILYIALVDLRTNPD
jgi:hypothetical protein